MPKEKVCELCEGTGVVESSNETGEEVWTQPCPDCQVDPEPEGN